MSQATLTAKQENKVVAFVAAAREAKSNGKLTGNAKTDNATILRIANGHKQATWQANGSKGIYSPWLCIPHFADAAISEGIGKQAVRKSSGKSKPTATATLGARNHKPECECIICTRIRNAHKSDAPVAAPQSSGKLTVEALASRVDSLDSKLDMILAKLAC